MARLLAALFLLGCTTTPPAPPQPVGETTSPKDAPSSYRVLKDETQNNAAQYHVLVAASTKHDDMQKLLEYIYRHLMTRREDPPATLAGHVYFSEAAFATPPRTPIASVVLKSGDRGPTFENRVPLEFWQEIDQALGQRRDQGFKLALKVTRDDAKKTVALTVPYTEPGLDQWAAQLSFNQAMQTFTDHAQALFEKVPELSALSFSGVWKDKDVVRIDLARADYAALKLNEIDERIGQQHGTAFLKLSTGRGTDQSVAKENAAAIAKQYRGMLAQLKGKAVVSPTLK